MANQPVDFVSTGNDSVQPTEGDTQVSGELTFNDKVIQKIIGIAMEKIDGLLNVQGGFFSSVAGKIANTDNVTAGIETEVGQKQVAVDMEIICEYGKDAAKIYDEIKQVVVTEVKKMTHLDVIEVNVNVADIQTEEEYEQNKETLQDKASDAADTVGAYTSEKTDQATGKINEGVDKAKEKTEPKVQ
ncbi:Asp23/Gls24 family envelope stress response protein [Tetragenococcus koreensis]|uniref:Stress response regulator gls24 homolog n=1 Tax=Tetragenococcus koreensis TaxID=290335 RepID=A0AAN4RLK3_9ENTE|nr:Asp23/Gls24 family envelope stress response protein [Tetragenococcus koreensis]MDN6663874.1 Asp23/Gls24 family envelope stress response protein [Tetragenococcus koreensis]GEQ48775.1 transcriptional regulator [Tetragenococcus koreensis]GEQ51234.1 transcriptional regulator [Tetragenococcus koreensis]GEQ53883.1 transcriptional regulator [Tetragenococcus koreensis]GEQ56235.1 transcriptional regulator [Tetragenococcus koreensis]